MAKAGLEIRADLQKFRKEMLSANAELRNLNKEAIKAATGVTKLEQEGKKASVAVGGLFKSIVGGNVVANLFTSAIFRIKTGLSQLVRGSIEASSALTELNSKAQVVFGDAMPKIMAMAKGVANEVGRASSQILQFATDFGSVIKAFGIAGPLMEDMSVRLARLAVDMASFRNVSDQEAFRALFSGLTGETEPLKRFGIVLTDNNLKLFALDKGLKQSVESMNQAQKTALRYEFIMDKTKDAQGDAARTAESYANQSRRLTGEIQTLQEELGRAVTPGLADGLGFLSTVIQNTRLFVRALTQDIGSLLSLLTGKGAERPTSQFGFAWEGFKTLVRPLADRIGGRLKDLKEEEGAIELGAKMDALSGFDALGGATLSKGGGGGKSAAEQRASTEKEIAAIEKEILQAMGEQAQRNVEILQKRREELKLRREMGVLTENERRELDRIDRRLAFQEDKINDATDAWREQVKALEDVEEKIKDINGRISEEHAKLSAEIADIENDANEDAIGRAEELIRKRNQIMADVALNKSMSAQQGLDINEINDSLSGFGSDVLAEGTRRAGLSDAARIEDDKRRRIEQARSDSDARLKPLLEELEQAQKNKTEIESLERQKKQAVIDALQSRLIETQATYKLLDEATTAHVNHQIAEFNRLRATLNGSVGSPAPAFASGGPVYGPGHGTADKINAWLSNGEYVINAAATRAYRPLLDKINSFSMPRFASGGPVTHHDERTVNVTMNNHGRAAEFRANPVLIRRLIRRAL